MLIKRIEIKNFRRLIGPVSIENLKQGINVIAGDNEEGKSTVLQALKALFFQRHTSTSQAVIDFQPYNHVVRPEVAIDFEWQNEQFSVRKGFCVKPYLAEFRSPLGNTQGSEAEEKISELFRLPGGEKGRKSSDPDHGLWGLLWMEQGTASSGLNMSTGGKESLLKALESDIGAMTGGQSGRVLLKIVASRCAEYYTQATGKEKGPLKEAREKVTTVTAEHVECELKYEQYKKKLIRFSAAQEALTNHARNKTIENARVRLGDAEKAIQQLHQLKLEEKAAVESERAAALEFRAHKEKLDNRINLNTRIETITATLKEKEKALKLATAELEKANAAVKNSQDVFTVAEASLKAAEHAIIGAEKRDQFIALQKSRDALKQTIDTLHEVQGRVDTQTLELQSITITQEIFAELRALETQATEAEIEARVASARVLLKPLPGKQASINENEVSCDEALAIAETTTITLKDWGAIEITPGGEDTAQLVKTAKFKRQKFAAALRRISVMTMQEATEQLDNRKQLMSEIEQSKSRIKMLCNGGTLQSLEKDFARMESQLASSGIEALGLQAPGDLNDFRKARDTARLAEGEKRQHLEAARQAATELHNAVTALTSDSSNLTSSLNDTQKQLAEISKVALDDQQKAVTDSERVYLEAQNRKTLITLKITETDGGAIEKVHESIKIECTNIENEIKKLEIEKSGLAGEINAEGTAGLGETLERLRGVKELSETQLSRIEKKARAMKLLLETLSASEREAKEHFLEPVFDKLKPHLQIIFPGASLILDKQDVEIAHLKRNGVDENYMSLSTGTREQLSVLTRLSIARLLKERNQPSFVVLDDALVYADARRFAQMKLVLQEVARDVQILVLTCRRSDYEDLDTANFIDFRSQSKVLS